MNKKFTRIYVVRHGESTANAATSSSKFDGITYNYIEGSPLSENGRKQVANLLKKIKRIDFSAVFSSDLARAKATAGMIALENKLALETSKAIRERSVHEYLDKEGLTPKDISVLEAEIKSNLKALDDKAKMQYKKTSNMESAEEGALRLLTFIRETAIVYLGKNILIVCHGNIMRSLLTHLGYAKFDELPSGAVKNTGYFILESDGVDFSIKEVHGIVKSTNSLRGF